MKKNACLWIAVALTICLSAANAFAASSITPSVYSMSPSTDNREWGEVLVIQLVCVAHTDGTFTSTEITDTDIPSRSLKGVSDVDYWKAGYFLLDAFAVNSATNDHTNAAVVTITDETTHQIIGATAGDTLTLSQTASAVAYASMSRSAAQRAVTSKLTVGIADTGSTATAQTIYIILGR